MADEALTPAPEPSGSAPAVEGSNAAPPLESSSNGADIGVDAEVDELLDVSDATDEVEATPVEVTAEIEVAALPDAVPPELDPEAIDADEVAEDLVEPETVEAEPPEEESVAEIPAYVQPSEPEPVFEENASLIGSMPEAARPPRQYYQEEPPTWLTPEFEAQQPRVVSPPLGRSPGRLPAVVLAVLMSGVFAMFLLIEPTPTWLILFGAIVAVVGTDGVLRSIRLQAFDPETGRDTAAHLFLPALFALTVPLFIEENVPSYLVVPAALAAGVAFVLVVLAEVPAEEDEEDEFHGRARFVSVAATYFVAFALFSLTYAFDLGLRDSLISTGLGSVLLAFGLLREGEIDHVETLLLACVVGVVVAEARWILQFMPLDSYPAGLALLLSFYFITGMVHAYMTRHINLTVAAEYSIVTMLGLAVVVAARATGVA